MGLSLPVCHIGRTNFLYVLSTMIVNIIWVISCSVINSAAEMNSIWLSASCLIIPEVAKVCADRSYKAWLSGKKATIGYVIGELRENFLWEICIEGTGTESGMRIPTTRHPCGTYNCWWFHIQCQVIPPLPLDTSQKTFSKSFRWS